MADWGPVFVAVVLFVLFTPGLLFQLPGRSRLIEFGNFQTSGASILVHSILYFAAVSILLLGIQVHMRVMADWAPVIIGVVLFVLLSPGLLFQLPGHSRPVEFGSMKTNGKAVVVHTLIFFAVFTILILALHIHIYTG
ncbi:hypothetical protein MRB53_007824 [Persea americana]|uniref:Uncharacterized protein n=1 Tax=Persea americana TaxID=3435 RepID=A0ACC2MJY8_PERAE|nr:hypothetical protein MRB53_007824 [Persea americana]